MVQYLFERAGADAHKADDKGFSPLYVAIIDQRLRQLTGRDIPFGGIMVMFVGDFVQGGPVLQTHFPSAAMEIATGKNVKKQSTTRPGTWTYRGVKLLTDGFNCYKCKCQKRSQDDSNLQSMLSRMHSGESIALSDLDHMKYFFAQF